MILAYVENPRGPAPQLWHHALTNGSGEAKPSLRTLNVPVEDQHLTLDQLAAKYPYPRSANV
jgi:hypothetical protein